MAADRSLAERGGDRRRGSPPLRTRHLGAGADLRNTNMIDPRVLLVITLTSTACGTPSPAGTPQSEPGVVTRLDSIDLVRERFNADVDKPRLLTILSPT